MLAFRAHKRLGEFRLQAELEVPPGGVLVLVGESGAGKTTLLRLLAGLERPDAGRIALDERTWFDSDARIQLPAAEREVGYLAQDYALFPHLTALENVAFGPRARGDSSAAARARAEIGRAHV